MCDGEVVFSLLLPTKKTVKETKRALAKKTDAVTADVRAAVDDRKADGSDAPVAELVEDKADELKEGVRTRAGKGKTAVADK